MERVKYCMLVVGFDMDCGGVAVEQPRETSLCCFLVGYSI